MIYNVHTESVLNKINEHVQKLNEAIKFIDIESIKAQFGNNVSCSINMNGSIGTRPNLDIKFETNSIRFTFRYNFATKKTNLYLYSFHCPYLYNKYMFVSNFSEFKKNITKEDMLFLIDCIKNIDSITDLEEANKKILNYNKIKKIDKDFK